MKRFVLLLVLVACAPAGSAVRKQEMRSLIAEGQAKLQAGDHAEAVRAFERAGIGLDAEPDEDLIQAITAGIRTAHVGVIREGVLATTRTPGDDAKAVEELDDLHRELRSRGGNAEIEKLIHEGINERVALLLAPHEAATTLTDLRPVLALAKYPQLEQAMRDRLAALNKRPIHFLTSRAGVAKNPLLKRVFEGLAAAHSGAAVSDAKPLLDRELAPYARGSQVTVTDPTGKCSEAAAAIGRLSQPGANQVDAAVTLERCSSTSRTELETYQESYINRIPYQSNETRQEQRCGWVDVERSNCVRSNDPRTSWYVSCGTSYTVKERQCETVTVTGPVTLYREEPASRTATRSVTYETQELVLAWRVTHQGATTEDKRTLPVTLKNGTGKTAVQLGVEAVTAALDAPVKAQIATTIATLKSTADAALTAGDIEQAELGYVRIILLGGTAGDHFKSIYLASDDDLRLALGARAQTESADRIVKIAALAAPSELRDAEDRVGEAMKRGARDRAASIFPPQLSRVRGGWYNVDLGGVSARLADAMSGEVGGGTSPSLGVRLGLPVLSRLHGRTSGLRFWDDLMFGAAFGYTATTNAEDKRGVALRGTAAYTLVAGLRAPRYQLLAGARQTASLLKVSGTTGHAVGLSYYGNLGFQIGKAALTFDAWFPSGVGDDLRGGQATLSATASRYEQAYKDNSLTSAYVAVRIDDDRFDACAASAGGTCIDVPALRVISAVLAFGGGF